MFVESITSQRDEWERWTDALRLSSDPPQRLILAVAWETAEGTVTAVNVWDSPAAVADFFVERVNPLIQQLGKPASTPQRHGEPLAVYMRR
jgi:hypothetical protein